MMSRSPRFCCKRKTKIDRDSGKKTIKRPLTGVTGALPHSTRKTLCTTSPEVIIREYMVKVME